MVDIERRMESPRRSLEPGSEAAAALIDEWRASFGVPTALAVFQRGSQRSPRVLEGLGFAAGPAREATCWPVEADEDLLLLHIGAEAA